VTVQSLPPLDPKTALIRDDYAANAADFPGAGLGWLDARRDAAIKAFARKGVPTRRVEEWKYTDLAAALHDDLEPATPLRNLSGDIAEGYSPQGAARIRIANGYLHGFSGAPLPDCVDVVDLSQLSVRTPEWVERHLGTFASGENQILGAASLALMRGGVAIRVRPSAEKLPPLHLEFVNSGRGHGVMSHARVLLVLEDEASLDLFETHHGSGDEQILANLGMELVLGANANLNHVQLQEDAGGSLFVGSIGARLDRDAHYVALLANTGAKLSRVDMNIVLAAAGASAEVRSVTALTGESHADVTAVMDHAAPHTKSRQLFKSVLGGRSRSVSQGRVTVRKGAVKSDSHQLFKALLMAPRAEADAKPELEIFADDVICGHGTAIGALDRDALFYLRARGIAEAEAKAMLVRAFLEEAIEGFADEAARAEIWRRIDGVLASFVGEAA